MSKLAIYLTGVLSGVVILVLGVGLFVWFWVPQSEDRRTEEWHKKHVQEREKANGINCESVSQRADQFIHGPLIEIIRSGRRGEDWVVEASTKHEAEIRWLRAKTFECTLTSAPRKIAKMPADPLVREKSLIFQALDVFITPYGNHPPTARAFKEEAFRGLERDYADLLRKSQSSR